MSATRPPPWFEALLRRAGRATRVGDAAVDDMRREHAAWVEESGRGVASVRYALAATALAVRLFVEGRRVAGPPRGGATRDLLQDLRFGIRTLARSPGFTATAALTFALGVGATTAIFAAVHAILLEPLPYPEPHELVTIEVSTSNCRPPCATGADDGWYGTSMPEYFDLEEQVGAFASIGAYTAGDVTMGDTLSPIRVRAVFASASLLPTLGVEPMIGRFFEPSEETSENNRYVVLSHRLWLDQYGGDRRVVGRTIPLFGAAFTVLGVMPPDFAFPDAEVRAYFPFGMNRANPNPRMNHFLRLVGRLAPGATRERAGAEVRAYTERAQRDYPEIYSERGFRGRVRSLHESVTGDVRSPLAMLMVSVVLVLGIACANVANLFLSRSESRRRELSVRTALGATGGRLARQLVTESLLLALVGGAAGLLLAVAGVRAIVAFAPDSLPRADAIVLGPQSLMLAFIVIAMAGAAFGTLPALRFARDASDGALVRGGRGVVARRARRRLRRGLVAGQVALACVITVGTGLMMRTVANLRAIDPGFEPADAISFFVSPSFSKYAEPEQRVAFWNRVLERLSAVPGVHAVGATSAIPFSNAYDNLSIRVEGRITTSIGDAADGRVQRVTPGLFEAMGIRLVKGRTFTSADRADGRPVVIVSQTFAERFWPGQDPLGKTMGVFADDYPWLEVVGVVSDIPHTDLDLGREPMWYVPQAQAENAYGTPLALYAVVRANAPQTLMPAFRAAIRDIDPTTPVSRVRLLDDLVAASLANRTFMFDLLQVFALVALFLAFIGLYGVAALAVAERHAEIGLRRALGAGRASLVSLVAGEILSTVALGTAAGILVTLAGGRVVRSLLFGVGTADAVTMVGTVLLLGLTACAAAIVPARRALSIEPQTTLREDG